FTPDGANRKRQSQSRVVKVARQVAEIVARAVERELVPLVLGGDCTITVGVVAGLLRHQPDLGLIYFDGDADLTTPETTHAGIFDSMGARPVELAAEARTRLEQRARAIAVHFDVDVMDSAEIPLADWPHYDA